MQQQRALREHFDEEERKTHRLTFSAEVSSTVATPTVPHTLNATQWIASHSRRAPPNHCAAMSSGSVASDSIAQIDCRLVRLDSSRLSRLSTVDTFDSRARVDSSRLDSTRLVESSLDLK